jgi:hypothetical protein
MKSPKKKSFLQELLGNRAKNLNIDAEPVLYVDMGGGKGLEVSGAYTNSNSVSLYIWQGRQLVESHIALPIKNKGHIIEIIQGYLDERS